MNRWMKWGAVALVVVLLVTGVVRALSARRAQQDALQAHTDRRNETLVDLGTSDLVTVQMRTLTQGLPVSGALKAVNSAFVKARVAGELQGLAVREGDHVQAGQVIARVDPTEYQARLRQAKEQADAARAQADNAQRQLDNNRALVEQGFISKTALDTSINNWLAAQSNHKAALAAMDVAQKALDDTVLKSPLAGLIAQRLTQNGERVAIDARVVEVVDLSQLELEATLAAADATSVRVGQTASLQIEGLEAPLTARVVRINPSAQVGSRSVLAYLRVERHPGLRQGLFAQGTLATGRSAALALPLDAVRTDKPTPYVQVVEQDRIVHRAVELGARGQEGSEMLVAVRGLSEASQVTAATVGPLREGTRVRLNAPTPSPTRAPQATEK